MIFSSLNTRSPVLSHKSFVCTTYGPLHACSPPVPPIAIHNYKSICNHSICSSSISSSSTNVESISKPAYLVACSSDSVINVTKSLKFTLIDSHSVD